MRWLFVGVVALNLLYFGWRMATPVDSAPTAQAAGGAVQYPAPLSLLAETGRAAGAPAPPALATSAPVAGCPALGPWQDEAQAKSTVQALAAAGFPAAARVIDIPGAVVYWVHMPPFAGRQQAMRKLRELQAKGIDSFVVSEGADANAISLGSFTSHDSALGVQSRLRAAGYGAEIREQIRDVRQAWVVLETATAQGYLEHVPSEFRDKLRQERLACR